MMNAHKPGSVKERLRRPFCTGCRVTLVERGAGPKLSDPVVRLNLTTSELESDDVDTNCQNAVDSISIPVKAVLDQSKRNHNKTVRLTAKQKN